MVDCGKNTDRVTLRPGEKAEPLGDGYYIIQSETGYRFGTDAVALAKFATRYTNADSRVYDLCSGSGVIGIMLATATGCTVDGAELDKELWDMSVRSCVLNGSHNITFYNADVRDINGFKPSNYDVVVCNPPFFKADSRPSVVAPQANSETTVTAQDIVTAAKRLLKVGGSFCVIHTASRLDEILCLCRENGLIPKELTVNANGKTFLLRAVRGGRPGMKVDVKEFA